MQSIKYQNFYLDCVINVVNDIDKLFYFLGLSQCIYVMGELDKISFNSVYVKEYYDLKRVESCGKYFIIESLK